MISTDEDALICDFAEYYNIYDYRGLPAEYAATLAVGLREDSRIKKKMSGIVVSLPTDYLLAFIADRLNVLNWWLMAKDGRQSPELWTELMVSGFKVREELGFTSGEEFDKAREEILKRIRGEA